MPYALIPEGFTLKKVTKTQEQAVKDHRRHEDVKTFLGNETTPVLIGGIAIATLTPALVTIFLALLKEQGVTVDDAQKAGIEGALRAIGPVGWTILLAQKAREDGLPDISKFWKQVI
jgi:hypothetical protein